MGRARESTWTREAIDMVAVAIRDEVMVAIRGVNELADEKITEQGHLTAEQSGYLQGCLTMADAILRVIEPFTFHE